MMMLILRGLLFFITLSLVVLFGLWGFLAALILLLFPLPFELVFISVLYVALWGGGGLEILGVLCLSLSLVLFRELGERMVS